MPTVTLRDVFEDCQKGIQSHGKLAKTLKKIYTGVSLENIAVKALVDNNVCQMSWHLGINDMLT